MFIIIIVCTFYNVIKILDFSKKIRIFFVWFIVAREIKKRVVKLCIFYVSGIFIMGFLLKVSLL